MVLVSAPCCRFYQCQCFWCRRTPSRGVLCRHTVCLCCLSVSRRACDLPEPTNTYLSNKLLVARHSSQSTLSYTSSFPFPAIFLKPFLGNSTSRFIWLNVVWFAEHCRILPLRSETGCVNPFRPFLGSVFLPLTMMVVLLMACWMWQLRHLHLSVFSSVFPTN